MSSSLRAAAFAALAALTALGARAQPPAEGAQAPVQWRCTMAADESFNVRCFQQPRIEPLPRPPGAKSADRAFLRVLEFVDSEDPVLAAEPRATTGWVIPLHTLPFSTADVERLLHAVMCPGTHCRISLQTRGI